MCNEYVFEKTGYNRVCDTTYLKYILVIQFFPYQYIPLNRHFKLNFKTYKFLCYEKHFIF